MDANKHDSDRTLRRMIVALAVTLLLGGAYVLYRNTLKQAVTAKLDEIRAAGLPATSAELDVWYPTPPAGENAADVYLVAFARMVNPSEEQNQLLPIQGLTNLPSRTVAIPADMRKVIAEYLDANGEALRLLHGAAAIQACRYPVDLSRGFATLLPHLGKIRNVARLLELQAVQRAEMGETEPAVQAVLDAVALSESLRNEPLLISQLVRMACNGLTVAGLERVLSRATLTDAQLAELAIAIGKLDDAQLMYRAFVGERCAGNSAFAMSPDDVLGAIAEWFGGGSGSGLEKIAKMTVGWTYKGTGLWDMDHLSYLNALSGVVAASQMQLSVGLKAAKSVEDETAKLPIYRALITRLLGSSLYAAFVKGAEYAGRVRAAVLGLAVERYRLAHGKWPATLDELGMPVPVDPFDGKPMRYKKTTTGFVVYSIGRDETDDGGMEKVPGSRYGSPPDITFTIERPSE